MHASDILKPNLLGKTREAELYCAVSAVTVDNSNNNNDSDNDAAVKTAKMRKRHYSNDGDVDHHKQVAVLAPLCNDRPKTGQLQHQRQEPQRQPQQYYCSGSAFLYPLFIYKPKYLCCSLLLLIIAVVCIEQLDNYTQMPKINNIAGFAVNQFAKVEKVFRKNFHDGWEREGAAIAVYYKGKLVVDLQGGYADASSLRPWTSETRTVVFSATKAIGALCIGILVDRGYLQYSDKVCQHWPEFAQNGKENITIDWVMSHRAGLAAFDEPILKSDALDHHKIARIIERQKPNWAPGTRSGYHAITYGWLVDQIIRHVDPMGRGIAQFFREEIAVPFGIDFHLGLPAGEEHTVSRLSLPSNLHLMKEVLYDPRILVMLGVLNLRPPNSIVWKVRQNPDWLKLEPSKISFNDPDIHRMEQVAALGITKARDFGKLFAMFLQGKIVSNKTLSMYRCPQISTDLDEVILAPMAKGHGFYYEKHPYKRGHWLFGHPGYGGSNIMMDMENEIVIAYVSNGLKTGMGELTRTYRLLRNAVLSSV